MRVSKLNKKQDGMVSLIVTMIIMIVLTLIVLGFAQLARREQRQALDRQLSAQAYYAAESGINDAEKRLADPDSAYYGRLAVVHNKPTCGTDTSVPAGKTPAATTADKFPGSTLDATTKVGYSCLLIDQTPDTLIYPSVGTEESTVAPLNPVGPAPTNTAVSPASFTISWENAASTSLNLYTPATAGEFPNVGTWGATNEGVLRVDLTATDTLDRASLISNNYTVFLYPSSSGTSSVNFSTVRSDQGKVFAITCTDPHVGNPKRCTATINMPAGAAQHYYLRMKSIYSASSVVVSGKVGANSVLFRGGQYVIDSTGKANDVLKRLRVRKPAKNGEGHLPDFVLNSATAVCKQMSVYPGGGSDLCDGGAVLGATDPGVTPDPGTPPPDTPPPSGLTGGANFDSNCSACNDPPSPPGPPGPAVDPYGGDPSNQYRWNIYVENHTRNNGLTNVSCLWTFSDGTTWNNNCQYGEGDEHVFTPRNPNQCMTYTVTLVVTFNNGTTSPPETHDYQLPWNRPPWYTGPCA